MRAGVVVELSDSEIMKRFNRVDTKEFRQKLRREATPFENILWLHLRKEGVSGFKFRRQHGIGSYIVDFYCPSARLVVEIDGDSHQTPEGKEKDKKRDAYLVTNHFTVLRFTNHEVRENIQSVVEKIARELDHIKPLGAHQPPQTPPSGKGGDSA